VESLLHASLGGPPGRTRCRDRCLRFHASRLILGNPDASSLIDLGASFTVIRQMSLVPIDKPTLLALVAAAALPMIPMILLVTPADQLVKTVLKMLG
jgi:hypothetical protein